ncbi:MAG: hypothetical protein AAGN35_25660 [Bacteroidota bacterium]
MSTPPPPATAFTSSSNIFAPLGSPLVNTFNRSTINHYSSSDTTTHRALSLNQYPAIWSPPPGVRHLGFRLIENAPKTASQAHFRVNSNYVQYLKQSLQTDQVRAEDQRQQMYRRLESISRELKQQRKNFHNILGALGHLAQEQQRHRAQRSREAQKPTSRSALHL